MESPVSGVTTGKIREELRTVAVFQLMDGGPAKPEAGDLDLTAGWGHAGKGGVTMPGKGKLIRRVDGGYDVFLNETACWQNVPEAVWKYTIGGYQVIKKMALVSGEGFAWTRTDAGRSSVCHERRAASGGAHCPTVAVGRKLPANQGRRLCLACAMRLVPMPSPRRNRDDCSLSDLNT
jgi:hypothetical protein